MLVLSRKTDESLCLPLSIDTVERILKRMKNEGADRIVIRVAVVEIRGSKVRLGVEASPTKIGNDIPIHRSEILQQIDEERSARF
jgi:sRNA-binding carbon storage regulator CsrA